MSRMVRKPDCCEADQRLYFRYIDSTIPFLSFTENFQSLAIPTIALKKSRQTFDCTANSYICLLRIERVEMTLHRLTSR